jgi:hypothetical protein
VRRSLFYGVNPSRQKTAHRFAESGYKSGYVFEIGCVFVNNPSILGFFIFQYDSCYRSQTAKIGSLASSNPQANPQGCGFRKCKPRSAGEGRSVTLKNLVRSEVRSGVRSGVRVRKKCLNYPTAAERGCCQFTEKVIKIANENLVRGEVRVKYAARTRTNGLRTLPPDCGFFVGVEAHRLFAGPEGRRQSRRGAAFRRILFFVFENTSARRRCAALFPGKVQFFECPFLNYFLRISLSGPVLPFSFHAC